jgi:hypothetical protein
MKSLDLLGWLFIFENAIPSGIPLHAKNLHSISGYDGYVIRMFSSLKTTYALQNARGGGMLLHRQDLKDFRSSPLRLDRQTIPDV